MNITNRMNLPAALVSACRPYPPTPGRYSVTELVGPAMLARLRREHWEELEEDVADRLWAIMGSAMHGLLAEHGQADELTEERLTLEMEGITVSGRPDTYAEDGTLSDWKFTTVYSHGEIKPEWTAQLNVYAHLLRAHGFPVARAQIIAIYRDWSRRHEAQGIPHAAVIPVPLWAPAYAGSYLVGRIRTHQDDTPPICLPDERWERPTTYAVMKAGRKTALRVLESIDAAQAWKAENGGDRIEERPGECVRCMGYCPVRQFCEFGRRLAGGEETE